jgi:acetylornithine deacetylase/succinyl-diaminopimelate desuccinylase-like protein
MAETRAEAEVVRLAADLIAMDTTNRGGGDCCERPAAEYAAARLAEAGLEPKLLEAAPGRTNVVARWEGTGSAEGALLFHGHLDVVPANPAAWSVHPFAGEISADELWGRGAVDMKGADAALLAVVRDWAHGQAASTRRCNRVHRRRGGHRRLRRAVAGRRAPGGVRRLH